MMIHERDRCLHGSTQSLAEIGDPRSQRILRTLCVLALLGILLTPGSALALRSRFGPSELGKEDKKVAESIAAYPASARRGALIAAGYPEELLEVQKIQRASADDFAGLVSSLPRADQEQIWNLVRHSGLAAEIARGGRKSASELERIASRYPAEDRAAIERQGRELYPTWVQIYAIELEAEQAFSELLSYQPDEVRSAFDELTKHPDLMSILLDNMRMTTVLGALYRDDRDGIEAHFDALHARVASLQQEEERAWSDEVRDPDASAELARAARAFAEAYDYDFDAEIEQGVDFNPAPRVQIRSYVSVHPYPYWLGYPYWYDVAYWYPLPIWSHVGFHFGHGHGFVSAGLPSLLFLNWYHSSYVPRFRLGHHAHHHQAQNHRVRYYEQHRSHRSHSAARRSRHHDSRSRHFDRNRQRRAESRTLSRIFSPTFRKHGSRESESRGPTLRPRKSERHERPAHSSEKRETTRKQRKAKHTQPSVDRQQSARADRKRDRRLSSTRRNESRVEHRTARIERRKARSLGRQDSHRGAHESGASSARKKHGPHKSKSSSRSDSHRQRHARSRR